MSQFHHATVLSKAQSLQFKRSPTVAVCFSSPIFTPRLASSNKCWHLLHFYTTVLQHAQNSTLGSVLFSHQDKEVKLTHCALLPHNGSI